MRRFDKLFFGLIIGSIFPVLFCILFVSTWFYFDKTEDRVLVYFFAGLLPGLIVNLKFLKGWIDRRYNLPLWFVAGIYIFCNICLYGLFMGFPVFNLALGLVAGYYFGKRIQVKNIHPDKRSKLINHVSFFTGFIMTLICFSSGFIALRGIGVGKDLQSMLGLGFEVTKPMIWIVTLIGGLLLILLQIVVTKITIIQTIKNSLAHQ
jgi:hypothetical protein